MRAVGALGMTRHEYKVEIDWCGNDGAGTRTYAEYRRDHTISIAGKPVLPGSSDPAFRGDASRYNPEELLVASLAACHMLWYLHLCADAGVVVTGYRDHPSGVMKLNSDGSGAFTAATLRPRVTITAASDAGIVVTRYRDEAAGMLSLNPNGSGAFTEVTLRPRVAVSPESDFVRALALHEEAHRLCFIAASVNFPVRVEAEIETQCALE